MSCSVRSALRKLIGRHASFDGIRHGRAEDIDDVAALGRRLVAKLLSLFLDHFLELCGLWFEAFLDGLYPGFPRIEACRCFRRLRRSAFLLLVRLAGAAGFSSGLCASSSAKLGGHACWSCGLTECEFLVLSQVVHVDVAIGLHPVFVGFDGERADEA